MKTDTAIKIKYTTIGVVLPIILWLLKLFLDIGTGNPVAKVKDVRPNANVPVYGIIDVDKDKFIDNDGIPVPQGQYLFINPDSIKVIPNVTVADTVEDVEVINETIRGIPFIYFKIKPSILYEGAITDKARSIDDSIPVVLPPVATVKDVRPGSNYGTVEIADKKFKDAKGNAISGGLYLFIKPTTLSVKIGQCTDVKDHLEPVSYDVDSTTIIYFKLKADFGVDADCTKK